MVSEISACRDLIITVLLLLACFSLLLAVTRFAFLVLE